MSGNVKHRYPVPRAQESKPANNERHHMWGVVCRAWPEIELSIQLNSHGGDTNRRNAIIGTSTCFTDIYKKSPIYISQGHAKSIYRVKGAYRIGYADRHLIER